MIAQEIYKNIHASKCCLLPKVPRNNDLKFVLYIVCASNLLVNFIFLVSHFCVKSCESLSLTDAVLMITTLKLCLADEIFYCCGQG